MAAERDVQCRNACFTVYFDHLTEDEKKELPTSSREWAEELLTMDMPATLKYIVFQEEICPTTNRHHIQAYAEFTSPKTYKQIQKMLLCPRAHIENRRGSQEKAIAYCQKVWCRAPLGVCGEIDRTRHGIVKNGSYV